VKGALAWRLLADLAERAVDSLLDSTTGRRLEDPWQYRGNDLTVGMMVAAECLEYLLHGFDMARAVGRDWDFSEPAADLALAVVGPVFFVSARPRKSRGPSGVVRDRGWIRSNLPSGARRFNGDTRR
jgi:hypothetical protein